MLYLLGVRTHPVVRILLGVAMIAAGVALHMPLLWVAGALFVLWGARNWMCRARAAARRQAESHHTEAPARSEAAR
jgi:threonine/homoserine/homoserine lactone efflux protein